MGPVRRVPSNFGDPVEILWTKRISFHPTLQLAIMIRWALWEAYSASPDLFAKFKERRKEEYGREWVKRG